MLIMNGPVSFNHPVTGVLVGPYQWYEGFAHKEHEEGLAFEVQNDEHVESFEDKVTEVIDEDKKPSKGSKKAGA